MSTDNFEIRDARSKNWFYLDNEILEVYGGKDKEDKGIGIHAIGVYMVLAKHANNDTQQCKPSYQTIATILGVSRNTVITAIKTLEKACIISIEQRISHEKNKPTTTNIYTLKNIKRAAPIPPYEPGGLTNGPPRPGGGIPLDQDLVYPRPPGVPKQHYSDNTTLNNTTNTMAAVADSAKADKTNPAPVKEPSNTEEPGTAPAFNPLNQAVPPVGTEAAGRAESIKLLTGLFNGKAKKGLPPATVRVISGVADEYPHDWVREVVDKTAVVVTSSPLNYAITILKHWRRHEFNCTCHAHDGPYLGAVTPDPLTADEGRIAAEDKARRDKIADARLAAITMTVPISQTVLIREGGVQTL